MVKSEQIKLKSCRKLSQNRGRDGVANREGGDGSKSERKRENLKYLLIYFLFNEIYSRIFQVPSWKQRTTALGHKPVRTLKVRFVSFRFFFFFGTGHVQFEMC